MNCVIVLVALVASTRPVPVGRLRYCTKIPLENVVWSQSDFSVDMPAYVYEVNGNARAALLVDPSEPTTATRMIYDVSNGLPMLEHFPTFRLLVHKYVRDINLTHLPHDERVQFLSL
jgi:hypothetical protein